MPAGYFNTMIATRTDNPPPLPSRFEYRLDLAGAATAKELKTSPRHRWFYFPHSFSHRLIDEALALWDLPQDGILADNFAGAGTTLLAARQSGLSAEGFDLSPLAVDVANAKITCYDPNQLRRGLQTVLNANLKDVPQVPVRLSKAFTKEELREIYSLLAPIRKLRRRNRLFFLTALLWAVKDFCRAVPDGGWFRWQTWPNRSDEIRQAFIDRVACMLEDVQALNWTENVPPSRARLADARRLPLPDLSIDGLITSPPYANRHDYSRVFHIDLLLLGLAEPDVTKLRHGSIRSHVEAKGPDGYKRRLKSYSIPSALQVVLEKIPADADSRIVPLLNGYFEDIYLSLLEVGRVLKLGGRAAYVVGNVRHAGVMVPVDEILVELAPQIGLTFDAAWVLRLRGNSAQQMKQYGRQPSRETIVFFAKDE